MSSAVAVGLVVALAFSNLVKAFTDDIVNPLIAAIQGQAHGPGFGWQLVSGGGDGTYLNLGAFISAIIYFVIYIAVVSFLIVYRTVSHGSPWQDCVWRSTANQDLPCVPVRRSKIRSIEM